MRILLTWVIQIFLVDPSDPDLNDLNNQGHFQPWYTYVVTALHYLCVTILIKHQASLHYFLTSFGTTIPHIWKGLDTSLSCAAMVKSNNWIANYKEWKSHQSCVATSVSENTTNLFLIQFPPDWNRSRCRRLLTKNSATCMKTDICTYARDDYYMYMMKYRRHKILANVCLLNFWH